MADEQTFQVLVSEFRRVGVDPDTFSAMLAVRPEEALRALRELPDDAGVAAFLARLREHGVVDAIAERESRATAAQRSARRRNRSA